MKAGFALALLVSSSVGSAAISADSGPMLQQVDQGYDCIFKVQAGADGYLYMRTRGSLTPVHGCVNLAFLRSRHPLSDPRTKALTLIATASLLSGNPVHVWTAGCTGPASQGYPILTDLQLNRE